MLVFEGAAEPAGYIGTIGGSSSIKVVLANTGKFEIITAVSKDEYETNYEKYSGAEAALEHTAQSQALAYYSALQKYTISVSPDNLTGGGTWIFNNNTNYWVDVQKVDNSGTSYAVISPNSLQVKVPIALNTNYSYKLIYKKELKYGDSTLAVADVSYQYQNDSFMLSESETTHTTALSATASDLADKTQPAVLFINNTDRGVSVYNGSSLLSNYGAVCDDYVLNSGGTALFTGLTENATLAQLKIASVAWKNEYTCTEGGSTSLALGKVYTVTVTGETATDSTIDLTWTVTEENASKYFVEDPAQ